MTDPRPMCGVCRRPIQRRAPAGAPSCLCGRPVREAVRLLVACETEPLWKRALMRHRPWSLLGRVT